MPRPKITELRHCTMEWCDAPLYAKGLCRNCYEKNRRGKLVDPRLPKTIELCAGPECDRKAGSGGLCKTHYTQNWHGKELTPIKPKKEIPERPGQRRCKTCDQWKDREEGFYNTSSGSKQGECKTCMVKRNRANAIKRELAKQGVDVS